MKTSEKTYTCLAVDDETHALDLIRMYVEKVPWLELTQTFTAPIEAMDWLRQNQVDLLFLDIQMHDLTGLQMLDIAEINCPVILTTAYSEYALESYEYQVTDYLLKPYSFDRFLKAVKKAVAIDPPPAPSAVPEKEAPMTELFVKGDAKNKFHRVVLKDILYIEGLRNYVQIKCKDKKIITLQNLKDLETQLPSDSFMRVHKSYIINLNNIDLIEGHSIIIGDNRIPVGASYRKGVYERVRKSN